MSNHFRGKDAYVKQYPNAKKWLNECIICQMVGYKLEIPQDIYPGLLAKNIRKMFSPLPVTELSICQECAKYLSLE